MNKKIKVLICDDMLIARAGLNRILEDEEDIEVVGEARLAQEIPTLIARWHPDVALIDLKWGDDETAGVAAIKQVTTDSPATRIIAITVYNHLVGNARQAGAAGALPKGFTKQELLEMIRAVHSNPALPSTTIHDSLSDREQEVLVLLSQGQRAKDIAGALQISENTVKNHIRHIMEKLGALSGAHAVSIGKDKGLIPKN